MEFFPERRDLRRLGSSAGPPLAAAVPWRMAVVALFVLFTGRLYPDGEEKASILRS